MVGWVDLGGWLHTEMVYLSPIQVVTGLNVECRKVVNYCDQRANHYTMPAVFIVCQQNVSPERTTLHIKIQKFSQITKLDPRPFCDEK